MGLTNSNRAVLEKHPRPSSGQEDTKWRIDTCQKANLITAAQAEDLHSLRKLRNFVEHRESNLLDLTDTAVKLAKQCAYEIINPLRARSIMKIAETCTWADAYHEILKKMNENDYDSIPYQCPTGWMLFTQHHVARWVELAVETDPSGLNPQLILDTSIQEIIKITGLEVQPTWVELDDLLTESVSKMQSTDFGPAMLARDESEQLWIATLADLPQALTLLATRKF